MGGGATIVASRHGREQEGRHPWCGGAGEGEAALDRRKEEEGRVPRGPEGLVGWLAAWAGRGWMAWAGQQAKAKGVGRPVGPSGLNSEEEFFSNKK
jgi:hypothetical protein